jgi:cob(I)alamin adenosyltransferase
MAMKLYTKYGDRGETALLNGMRVAKDDPRVGAYGEVDELNAMLGWCRCADEKQLICGPLQNIQEDLFVIGAELATPPGIKPPGNVPTIGAEHISTLEGWIDEACAAVEPLKNFVLPGGTELAARLHLARTCCRRAERAVVSLARNSEVRPDVIVYLNRLSDLLFAWARRANRAAGCPDLLWVPDR